MVEPFAGSACYSLRYNVQKATLVDVDPIIAGLWEYLIRVSETEILALPDIPPGGSVDDFAIPQEAKWLIGFWLNQGSSMPKKTAGKFGAKSTWNLKGRQRVVSQLPGIRQWKVINADYQQAPVSREAVYFVDPPYLEKGTHYRFGRVDHPAVGQWAETLPGRVIVCEQAGADWLPFKPVATVPASYGWTAEVAWLRGWD